MSNRSFAFVTTCSEAGWSQYGKKFVESFIEFFPKQTKLYIYVDFKSGVKHPRVVVRQLTDCTGLDSFQAQVASMPFATGERIVHDQHATAHSANIIWNARKFSFKVFSVEHAVLTADEHDVVTWIDADCVAFQPIPIQVIADLIPPYCMLSYLGRSFMYSECGYVSYNLQHPLTKRFAEDFSHLFRSGCVFSFKEWHDSYVFDVLRTHYESLYGVENFNISHTERYADHVFVNSQIGRYVDHLKGGRKEKGRSDMKDLMSARVRELWNQTR